MEQEEKKVHDVVKGDNCYYCTICKVASGDGDGLVGKECGGLPPLAININDVVITKDKFGK
jgi:hypothetical protein